MNSNTSAQTSTRKSAALPHTRQPEIPAAWREFSAGMEFLRRYGTRNTGNTGAIGRDNLRLLHRSLLQDNAYRSQVKNARKQMSQYAQPCKTPLLASSQLSAQLISIPADNSIQLSVRPGELGMLMIISGSLSTTPQLATQPQPPSNWFRGWPLTHRGNPDLKQFKADDIFYITPPEADSDPNSRRLSTHKKSCVILAVFTNHQLHASQTSHHAGIPLTQSPLPHTTP